MGYLLGAGSSYLDNAGYPLAIELWDLIKDTIPNAQERTDIQVKIDNGATGIEHALDLLDDGGANDTPYRHLVTTAIAESFSASRIRISMCTLSLLERLSHRADLSVKVFSLNYDPLVERAAEFAKVRVSDGFLGVEHAYFASEVFEERIGRIQSTTEGASSMKRLDRQYTCCGSTAPWAGMNVLDGAFGDAHTDSALPNGTKRLMVPPQRRKAVDTMHPPYTALWSTFRDAWVTTRFRSTACLLRVRLWRRHVNAVIEAAMTRTDFTLLIFTKELSDPAWDRWSVKSNAVVVTKTRCAIKGNRRPWA